MTTSSGVAATQALAIVEHPAVWAVLAVLAVLAWPPGAVAGWLPAGKGKRAQALHGWAGESDGQPAAHLVPEAMELMALALLGGGSVARAARSVGETLPPPLADELAHVAAMLQLADDPQLAWDSAGAHWWPARQALDLASRAGVPPRDALLHAAGDLRREAVADVEVAAARLGVLLVLPLGLAYLPAFVLTTIVPVVVALTRDVGW